MLSKQAPSQSRHSGQRHTAGRLALPPEHAPRLLAGHGSPRHTVAHAIHIDRRQHLELAWQRAEERAGQLDKLAATPGAVVDVADIQELEQCIDRAGSNLVVLFFHSRSCGVCKEALQRLDAISKEAQATQARVLFLRHNVVNEYDDASEIARMYKIKAVPQLLFFDQGAVIRRLSLRDIRGMSGPRALVQAAFAEDMRRVRSTLQEVLLARAPSARS